MSRDIARTAPGHRPCGARRSCALPPPWPGVMTPADPRASLGRGRWSDGAATSTGTTRTAGRAMTAPSVPRPAPPAVATGTRPDVQGLRAVAVLLVMLAHV